MGGEHLERLEPRITTLMLRLASLEKAYKMGASAFLDKDQCFIVHKLCVKIKTAIRGRMRVLEMENLISKLAGATEGLTLSNDEIRTFTTTCRSMNGNLTHILSIKPFKSSWKEGYKLHHPAERVNFPIADNSNAWKVLGKLEDEVDLCIELLKRSEIKGILSKASTMIILIRLRRDETMESPPEYRALRRKLEIVEN